MHARANNARHIDDAIQAFQRTVSRPNEQPSVEAAHIDYATVHRSASSGLRLLGRIFGEKSAQRYIGEMLLASSPGARDESTCKTSTRFVSN